MDPRLVTMPEAPQFQNPTPEQLHKTAFWAMCAAEGVFRVYYNDEGRTVRPEVLRYDYPTYLIKISTRSGVSATYKVVHGNGSFTVEGMTIGAYLADRGLYGFSNSIRN